MEARHSRSSSPDALTHRQRQTQRLRMSMNQAPLITLLFVLLAGPVWMHQCFGANKLGEIAERKLRNHYPPPPEIQPSAEQGSPASCPVGLYQFASNDIGNRSLSPWRYVRVTNMDQFPHTYVEAECLCSGCIVFKESVGPQRSQLVVESYDYSSRAIKQSRVFFKREPCGEGKGYYLRPVNVDVTVACTCVRANVNS